MKRPIAHQIGTDAQNVFTSCLPSTWVSNAHTNDYGKDYLVEIGADNGNLTGTTFFVQLKGQKKVSIVDDGASVAFSLKTKHAAYYLDKILNVPVFLVVVDTTAKVGWWVHVQAFLQRLPLKWRAQDHVTVQLPTANQLSDTSRFRRGVVEANRQMRMSHPLALHEAIDAQRQRISSLDPRCDVMVTAAVGETPRVHIVPKETFRVFVQALRRSKNLKAKIDLLDEGKPVRFGPGEVRIAGSRVFEAVEFHGATITKSVRLEGTISIICRDSDGNETGRLNELHGEFRGGPRQLTFFASLAPPLFSLELGPITPQKASGATKLQFTIAAWNSQPVLGLAYFDQIAEFLIAASTSPAGDIECYYQGNRVFAAHHQGQVTALKSVLVSYLDTMRKARRVCKRLGINPTWSIDKFDRDAIDTTNELHGVLFEGGWTANIPHIRITATCSEPLTGPPIENTGIKIISLVTYEYLGQRVEVGRLVQEYTSASLRNEPPQAPPKSRRRSNRSAPATFPIQLIGGENTTVTTRMVQPGDE